MSNSGKGRIVLLPHELDNRLDNLVTIQDEVNGILIYKFQDNQFNNYCPILSIFMTGKGTPGHVQADAQRINIANELFNRHPDYGFVKFHTHSIGTIKLFGEHYATNFSQEDINGYKEQIEQDPRFIGMVVTPQTKLLYGIDNPILKISNSAVPAVGNRLSEEIKEIARLRGYDLQKFRSYK